MRHRYTFLAGIVVGIAIGVFGALLLTAPDEQQVQEQKRREAAAALRAVAAALETYSHTISTNGP